LIFMGNDSRSVLVILVICMREVTVHVLKVEQ